MNKASKLRELMARPGPIVIVGAHNGISGKIGEEAGFDGLWASGFEISASYAVPDAWVARMNLKRMDVALIGRNLFTWTSFPNFDPENSSNAGNGGKGFDMGALPTMRAIGFNFSITP